MTAFSMKKLSSIGAGAILAAGIALMGAAGTKAQAPASVGSQAPDFTLTAIDGSEHTLSDYTEKGSIVVLEWFNPDCPFVKKHYRDDTMTMINMEKDLDGENVVWLRINSGHAKHATATKDRNTKAASDWGITSPVLLDHAGDVGRAYGAKRTPEMYIIDSSGVLRYHGAIDNDSGVAAAGKTNYVNAALTQIMGGEAVTRSTTKAYGCSVKYN